MANTYDMVAKAISGMDFTEPHFVALYDGDDMKQPSHMGTFVWVPPGQHVTKVVADRTAYVQARREQWEAEQRWSNDGAN